uniref:Replication enhancer n=1 Tax=Clerodendron yellow mosaic virus TaxID=326811 RepID=A0A0K0P9L2_9GEMI|nr:replication enhancer protein [Clerodendron yellow mosaic virus]
MDSRTEELITAAQATSGVFIWEVPNPLYFKILSHLDRPFFRNHDIITIQIRFNHNLRRALGLHKCCIDFRIWTSLHPQTGRFLTVFRTQIMRYLDNLGVICINNVFKAVDHVLYNVIQHDIDVEISHEIKFLLY